MNDRSTPTALITLGRLPTGLDIARALHGAGWRVVVAEPWAMHLSRMSRSVSACYTVTAPRDNRDAYLTQLAAIAESENADLVIPVSEETLHVATLRGDLPVFGDRVGRIAELHDKYRFNRLAASLGLDVPRTALAGSPGSVRLRESGPFVSKPRHSCSGRGVSRHDRGAVAVVPGDAIVQQHLDGEVLSSFALARDGETLGCVVYRGAVMSGSVAVCFERADDAEAARGWTRRFIAATGYSGFIAFDFIATADGRTAAIECNPRVTSGIHFFEPDSLAGAMLEGTALRLRAATRLAEKYSCFTATLGSLFSPGFLANARYLVTARDVTWSRQDPRPFLLMMRNTWPLIRRAMRQRATFAEVAVQDIEWREADGVA